MDNAHAYIFQVCACVCHFARFCRLYATSERLSPLIAIFQLSFVSAMGEESSSSDSLNLQSLSVEELCDWLGKKGIPEVLSEVQR